MKRVFDEKMRPEDAIVHFGVKGMKWGVRKKSSSVSKPSTTEIKDARTRHNARLARGIATINSTSPTASKTQKQKTINELKRIANDPNTKRDLDVATRATKGEKIAGFLIAGPIGNIVVNSTIKSQRKDAEEVLEL